MAEERGPDVGSRLLVRSRHVVSLMVDGILVPHPAYEQDSGA